MATKAIIFDCFGVLVMSKLGSLLHDFPEKATELRDLSLRSDYGYISRADYGKEVSELTGIRVDTFEPAYWKHNVRNESAIAWIRALKATNKYKIGLLSNIGREWLSDFLPEDERRELFDDEVLSSMVGMIKPDPEIFQLMADKLGVAANECIMIDDLVSNIEGASRIGMPGIVFGSVTQAQQDLERLL